jgi:rare lipoprotein A
MKKPYLLLLFISLACTNIAMGQDEPAKPKSEGSGKTPAKRIKKTAKIQYGMASFYHNKFQGRKTSSGEKFDQDKMTAAHNGLPLNTWIRVTNIRNGRTVIVKVNDRLHHRNERLVDLSRKAASRLGYIGRGLARVKVEVLGKMKPADIAKKDL